MLLHDGHKDSNTSRQEGRGLLLFLHLGKQAVNSLCVALEHFPLQSNADWETWSGHEVKTRTWSADNAIPFLPGFSSPPAS